MHVLMTTDSVGGVWTYSLTLIKELRALGTSVSLAVLGPAPTAAQVEELGPIDWHHHTGRLEWMPDSADDVRDAGDWLLQLADRVQPDVLHLNGYAHAAWPFTVPVLTVAHSCVCSWWRAVKREPAPAAWDVYRTLVTDGLAEADAVVAPTAAMRQALVREYGFTGDARVIVNGSARPASAPVIKEPLVFSAGRLDDEAKNLALIERAVAKMEWPVVVAGPLPDGRIRGEADRLTYLGRCSRADVSAWMHRAGIYALPARYEPFGLSILEAAQRRCALVIGDVDSLREVWGDAAWFVDPDDPDALAAAVNTLATDSGRRQRLAAAAKGRALRYGAREQGGAYAALYRDLIGSFRRSSPMIPVHACAS